MEENRDQILSDFQSCTGVEDIAECIMYLEASDWNLLDAINNVMPQETQTLPSEHSMNSKKDSPVEEVMIEEVASAAPAPSTSSKDVYNDTGKNSRLLKFLVKHQERIVPIEIPDSETVGTLKTVLFTEIGVTPCRQELRGWKRNHMTDETVLSSLNLSPQTNLQVATPDVLSYTSDGRQQTNSGKRYNTRYNIIVTDASSNREHDLKFPGSKTVLEMKQDIDTLTSIPVRFQRWSGWPDLANDENLALADVGLNFPVHRLTLRQDRPRSDEKKPLIDLGGSDSSADDFEDSAECFTVDDDIFQVEKSKKMQPLMQDNVVDELAAVIHFIEEFSDRYGDYRKYQHAPAFFQGTLADALQASCHKPAKERRPLAVYLHCDSSVLTNVFCTQVLCSETVVNYLAMNFITWPWDLTFESNKSRFQASVSQHLGIAAASAIRHITVNNLPALMVIGKVRSSTEVLTVVPGSVTLDELMTRLIHSVEMFNSGLAPEIREEEERVAREQVKREQDEAYNESLMADRLKDQTRKQEEEEKMRQEREEQQLQAVKEAVRQSLADQLPSEPDKNCTKPVSHIKVRLPSGKIVERRFLVTETLHVLLMYLASLGFPSEEYKVLASWPRRDLSALDARSTLQEIQLCPMETITLEER